MAYLESYIHNVFIGIIALFPVINPVGTAFVVNHFFSGLSRGERRRAVFKVTMYVFYLCTVVLFSGHWILQLFGLSVPIVKIAGGIMICKIGWDLLSGKSDSDDDPVDAAKNKVSISDKLFYPITFPMTAGAGTISVLFTLSARSMDKSIVEYLINASSILVSVIALCILVFFMYLNTNNLTSRIGSKNIIAVNRIMAFLIFCVGLEIASGGVMSFINKSF